MSFPYDFSVDSFYATFSTNDAAVEFLLERGVMKSSGYCEQCDKVMTLQKREDSIDKKTLRCCTCKRRLSIRHGTFLEKMACTARKFLLFLYFWSSEASIQQLVVYTGISKKTCIDYSSLFRDIPSWKFSVDDQMLGGVGHIVQIDESLIFKPKYNRGSGLFRTQQWIFGIYDTTTSTGAAFFVEDRSAETLCSLITRHIIPGSEIHSDQWAAYSNIAQLPVSPSYVHKTVNHSLGFINRETGVHTNNVEAYWASIKRVFKRMCGTRTDMVSSYIDLHMYKQRYGNAPQIIFDTLLSHIEERYRFN
jgi:IS1 family transposase